MIKSLKLTNFLSFGPDSPAVELGALNVLIGANGSGKSNFLAAFDILKNAPSQIFKPVQSSGGVDDWVWKYGKKNGLSPIATIQAYIEQNSHSMCYEFAFAAVGQEPSVQQERITQGVSFESAVYDYLKERSKEGVSAPDKRKSILAQWGGPAYPEITSLSEIFSSIGMYREWEFGPYARIREFQGADLPTDRVEPYGINLSPLLNRLRVEPKIKERLLQAIGYLYAGIEGFDVDATGSGGRMQVFFWENGLRIPAWRLSDGTLRFIWLLALLCDPNPPPIVCIEEPELGLHPDMVHSVAELLQEASERCQLIVTTHSVNLVDAMTERHEAILVCEKDKENGTIIRRPKNLASWIEKYRLGELWTSGDIGGNRW